MKRLLRINTVVVLSLAVCVIVMILVKNMNTHSEKGTLHSNAYKVEHSQTASTAPTISLKDFATSQMTTIDFSEKPTVLLFFTSWCPYCNEDAPKVVELQKKYKDKINIYGINLLYRDDRSELQQYLTHHKIDYSILLDETGDTYDQIAGDGFPSLYFYKTDGTNIDRIIGSVPTETIERSIDDLLAVN